MNGIVSSPNTTILLSKYSSTEENISLVFRDVQNIQSSWILHDLNIIIMNCTLGNSRFYLANGSTSNIGMVHIKNSRIWDVKVIGGNVVNIEDCEIHILEAEETELFLTRLLFSPESILKANQCYMKTTNVSMNSGEIHIVNSSLFATNSMLGSFVNNTWIMAEKSNIILQNSVFSNVQMIKSKPSNVLSIENSVFQTSSHILSDAKCALCIDGVKNITIHKSKFFSDKYRGYRTLFNISYGSQIKVLESQFETGNLTHLYISSGRYNFSTRRSTFKKGNFTLHSNQTDFMKDAVDAGITEIFSAKVFHTELEKGIKNNQSLSKSNIIVLVVSSTTAAFVCIAGFHFCLICWRKIRKRNRQYDAFLFYNFDTDYEKAQNILDEMERKYQLKLGKQTRDFSRDWDILENIHNAINGSNNAIVMLSCGFLESIWCREEMDLCLTEQLKDPSFKVVMILTEDVNTLLKVLSDKKSQNPRLFARIRSHLRRYTYLQFNDLNLHEKLIKTINFKIHKMPLPNEQLNAHEILSKNSVTDEGSLDKFTEDSKLSFVWSKFDFR